MPFPLAHPAAALPFRRYCPSLFSFPALVVGSLAPDLGYCFGKRHLEDFSHGFVGSFGFALPVGLLIMGLWYAFRSRLIRLLPDRHKHLGRALCEAPLGSVWTITLSLLVGAWTHIFWDSFTHKNGWFVQNVPFLQFPIGSVDGRNVRVCHLLWYGFSFAGVAALFVAYRRWQERSVGIHRAGLTWTRLQGALLVGFMVLPIELIHHLVRDWVGALLVAAGTVLLVIVVVWGTSRALKPLHIEN
jgi:hypothetical protein